MERWVHKRPKKNLGTYIQLGRDIGWTPASCSKCETEVDEFINGKVPCKSKKCKLIGNLTTLPMGDWRQFTVGINEILEVAAMVFSLSPLDSEGYPNAPISEIMALPFEVGFDSRDFFELIAIYMSDLRSGIAQERKWKAQQNKV